MSVSIVNTAPSASAPAPANPGSAVNGQDFLQLLVTQLQNQDPLNPVDNQQFIAQMAQLSTLDATNQLASQVGQMVAAQQQMGLLQLVGHDVQYTDATGAAAEGKVTGVSLSGPAPSLMIGSQKVSPGQIQTVL